MNTLMPCNLHVDRAIYNAVVSNTPRASLLAMILIGTLNSGSIMKTDI
jgi:hypothetical protein